MKLSIPIFATCLALTLPADTLQFEGVIGNSGERERPVTFAPLQRDIRGLGAAFEPRRGVLFDRAGSGRLNAYALDGRLLAQYSLPAGADRSDAMTLCGDHLVLLLRGQLYTLRTDAPDGTAAEKIKCSIVEPEGLSSSARDGRVAVRTKPGALYLLDPANGATTPFGQAPGTPFTGMDWDADGDFFVIFSKTAHKLQEGRLLADAQWPRQFAGARESGIDRATHLDGYWYGSAWHGTIKRFSSGFEPAPGVILGGASGHFIGHVACNYDVELAQGISEITPGIFAIGGMYGIVQLAEWEPAGSRLVLRRRIGALAPPGGVALDSQGRILAGNNIWQWSDDALAPAAVSHVFQMITPCAQMDPDTVVGLAEVYGKPSIAMGRFSEEELYCNRLDNLALPRDIAGLALYRELPQRKGGWRLLILGAAGATKLHEIADDPRNPWRRELAGISLHTATPVKRYTALTLQDPETLLAAGDGTLITFQRDGADWREYRRWSDGFGPDLRIAVSGDHLAVADTGDNRVMVYALSDKRRLGETAVNSPSEIAINGAFVAVYDSAGQRLMKFRLLRP